MKQLIIFLSVPVLLCGCSFIQGGEHLNSDSDYGKVEDADGNKYATVIIGDQEWMAENLRTSHYLNGDLIPEITDPNEWTRSDEGASCYYGDRADGHNDYESLVTLIGKEHTKLYNWYSASDPRGICPKGWRVPSEHDFRILINTLGGTRYAGNFLLSQTYFKQVEKSDANIQYNDSINGSGFSALLFGYRTSNYGEYYPGKPLQTGFWTTPSTFSSALMTESEDRTRHAMPTIFGQGISTSFVEYQVDPNEGRCIRCIKENSIPSSKAYTNLAFNYGQTSDIEGNVYSTIKIGSRTWMAENLRSKIFSNGDSISEYILNEDFDNGLYKAEWYTPDEAFVMPHGLMYDGYAVLDGRNVCPSGWHVADVTDWADLKTSLQANLPTYALDPKLVESDRQHLVARAEYTLLSSKSTGFEYISNGTGEGGNYYGYQDDRNLLNKSGFSFVPGLNVGAYNSEWKSPKVEFGTDGSYWATNISNDIRLSFADSSSNGRRRRRIFINEEVSYPPTVRTKGSFTGETYVDSSTYFPPTKVAFWTLEIDTISLEEAMVRLLGLSGAHGDIVMERRLAIPGQRESFQLIADSLNKHRYDEIIRHWLNTQSTKSSSGPHPKYHAFGWDEMLAEVGIFSPLNNGGSIGLNINLRDSRSIDNIFNGINKSGLDDWQRNEYFRPVRCVQNENESK